MMMMEQNTSRTVGDSQVEIVDNWDRRWPLVVDLIRRQGLGDTLNLDEDGWLSSRQSVVVAFEDDTPRAFLCFHIHALNRAHIEARLDSIGFADEAAREFAAELRRTAVRHSRELRCTEFKGI
jgi:hypothetical protein